MAMLLVNPYLSKLPVPAFNEKSLQRYGAVAVVASAIRVAWKLLRRLSLQGDSQNPLLHLLHRLLRPYLNCGWVMRSEFSAMLPWQFYVMVRGRQTIVNYGSYGTVPLEIQNYQFQLLRQLEHCPDRFFRTRLLEKYEESRTVVAKAVGCHRDNLVFVENITDGVNATLRSLLRTFKPGDAILCLRTLSYTAVLKAVDVLTKKYNIEVVNLTIEFPIVSVEAVCAQFEEVLKSDSNIKLALFDHITSATAVLLPVGKLAAACRKYDVISVVDGAHAPGQLKLDIERFGVDVYIGNLHKWYYTPKSCALMYVHPSVQERMYPSLVSHHAYLGFHARFWRQGTKDYTAMMVAARSVQYMQKIGGMEHLHSYITPLVEWAVEHYKREWGTQELDTPKQMKAPYMRVVYLPNIFNEVHDASYETADKMMLRFLTDYSLVMFINPVQGRLATRVSAQIFSTRAEYKHAAQIIKHEAEKLAKQEK